MENKKIGKLVLSLALPAVIGAGMATVNAGDVETGDTLKTDEVASTNEVITSTDGVATIVTEEDPIKTDVITEEKSDNVSGSTGEKENIANAEETKEAATEESATVKEKTVKEPEVTVEETEKTEVEVESETEQIETEKAEEETKVEEKKEEEEISDPIQGTKVYVVNFDTNGGQGLFKDISTGEISVTRKYGSVVLPKNKPTREGYTFVEWNSERDGSGAISGKNND